MVTKRLTPIQSIKDYCKNQCCAGDLISWKECSCVKCPLFAYRVGKRPKTLPFQEYTKKHRDLTIKFSKLSNPRDTHTLSKPLLFPMSQVAKPGFPNQNEFEGVGEL